MGHIWLTHQTGFSHQKKSPFNLIIITGLFLKEIESQKSGDQGGLLNGKYKLIKQIGEGAEAYVYMCEDVTSDDTIFRLYVIFLT